MLEPGLTLDPYFVNGVSLLSPAWRLAKAEGLQDAPPLRGGNVVVPSAHGALDPHADPSMPRQRYDPGTITFYMWLLGVDPVTALPPTDPDDLSAYFARLSELQRLFNARQLVIDHPRADGDRRAIARLAAPIKPVRDPSSPWFGSFAAECTIPGAFWSDVDETTVATDPGGVASGTLIDLSALACEAPITDALLWFGPGNNPSLIQGGSFFAHDEVITSGRELLVDTGTWQLTPGAGTTWAPDREKVRYGPGPSWFELDPTAEPLQAALTHTGGGLMACSITARRKHLTS